MGTRGPEGGAPAYSVVWDARTSPTPARGLRFTAAHEFFHAVHFAYYLSLDAAWWYELTATWIQGEVFTDVNDHYTLVNAYLELPEAAIYEPPPISLRPYGAMLLAVHLASVHVTDVIRSTFEDLASRRPNPYTISDTEPGLPGGFAGVLPRYWIWNYLTGSRALSAGYYPEASAYQEVNANSVNPIGSLTLGGIAQVQSLGATYVRIPTQGRSGGLRFSFDLPSGPTWNLDVLLMKNGSVEVMRPSGTAITVPDAGTYDEVAFVASVLSLEGLVYETLYSVSMSSSIASWSDLVGDVDQGGSVGFEDFIMFSESFGKPAGEHDIRCDLDANGFVDFGDFLIFANHFGDQRSPSALS